MNAAFYLRPDVERQTNTNPPYLGIQVLDLPDRAAITMVQAGSPAEGAGLQVNDEIVSVSGIFLDDVQNTFSALMNQHAGGEQIELGVIRFGESDLSHINVTLSTLLPSVIVTPSAEITVNDNTEVVIDIGFNGVTGVLVLADSAQVREPVSGSQVNVPAGSAVIVAPGYQIGNPIHVNNDQVTSWWQGEEFSAPVPSAPAPTAAPVITPVVRTEWIVGLGVFGLCGIGILTVGMFVFLARRRSSAVAPRRQASKPARRTLPPPESLDKGPGKPPPPERLK